MQTSDAVLRFLERSVSEQEADFYLRMFRSAQPETFALIAVDTATARDAQDAVALDLRCLGTLGLTPVVALGLHGPDDVREHAGRLCEILAQSDVKARALAPGAASREVLELAREHTIPIVCLGADREDARLSRLAGYLNDLRTRKLIFLQSEAPIVSGRRRVSIVNLDTDYELLVRSSRVSAAQRRLLRASRRLIFERVEHALLIALTSPLDLLRELFTVKGAGTILRRGAVIQTFYDLAEVDRARLEQLLESSFGRKVDPRIFERKVERIYLESGHRGMALLTAAPRFSYLSKFAVTREAQGEGIGRDIWAVVIRNHPRVVWRARPDSTASAWYHELCDGLVRFEAWTVFFKGIDTRSIPAAIQHALSQPEDFPRNEATL
jgi:hypothetical protein